MSKKALFLTIFFVVLFLLFYWGVTLIVPGYGEVKLPVLSYVQPFSFTNQRGQQTSNKDLAGKVSVVDFFFTTCKGICPKMNTNMKQIYNEFRSEPDFRIVSFTVNPQTDTVGRMKHYADSLGADPANWLFLTGRKQDLYNTARVSYMLDDPKNNFADINDQFIHTQFFALVDKSGRVRKIYDGLKQDEFAELRKDISYLLKEKVSDSHYANTLFRSSGN